MKNLTSAQLMAGKQKNRETLLQVLKNVENPLYWLAVMVTAGDLTESEAGRLIMDYNIK